ncbi:tetratricopeptide repeat protein [Sinanaerobacter chloroacetimidivorans]|uniref:Tetratricopeptide repeat protein n=1 Tax=Sinanaerobacter chloroacetimidivorans TaxID=2818044 RepID=A0A8J7W0M4_9FIRM|nr:tetratricopeptide repeat protein [Sinanaerobacter chloroacetimidivorans]MBR0597048.1 tetratricopeptide repeat protein [Sinanaerobacter chloroacetimidivorans]
MGNPVGEKMVGFLKKKETQTEAPLKKPEEYDIRKRPDRVGRYFKKYTKTFVFDEFSEAYLKRVNKIDFMRGVPIPLRKQDMEEFKGGEGLKVLHIAENMAWILGIDPKFQYADKYIEFMDKLFHKKIVMSLVKEGRDAAEEKDYDNAAIHFRAALCLSPDNLHALYSYARVCRELYLGSNNEEYVGRFKAEAMEYFELVVEGYPRFGQAYYYLGYAYLNMGLYTKAKLTWEQYLKKSNVMKDKKEIRTRLSQIEQPVEIEKGYTAILATRYEEGIRILEPYLKTNFKDWWPMSYYLGIAYTALDRNSDAIASFKRVLSINGSHVESMDELAAIYGASGDTENESKYRKKAELLRSGGHKEKKGGK